MNIIGWYKDDSNIDDSRYVDDIVKKLDQPLFIMDMPHLKIYCSADKFEKEHFISCYSDSSSAAVLLGEVYNLDELVGFDSTDNAVSLLHLYENIGYEMFVSLNGNYLVFLYCNNEVFIARDRFGTKNFFYGSADNCTFFSNNINFISSVCGRGADARCIIDISSAWSTIADRTFHLGIHSLEQGSILKISGNNYEGKRYFYPVPNENSDMKYNESVNKLDDLLYHAVSRRLDNNNNIAFLLSGGLDSSLLAAMASREYSRLNTFSVIFADEEYRDEYNESAKQKIMANFLNSNHHTIIVSKDMLVSSYISAILCVGVPMMRMDSATMSILFNHLRDSGMSLAISGQGADELFGGYDLFKEVKIRQQCQENPESKDLPLLYKKLYSYINEYKKYSSGMLASIFNSIDRVDPLSSHRARFRFSNFCEQFLSSEARNLVKSYSPAETILASLPQKFYNMNPLQRSQYIETETFMCNYLLSSQGGAVAAQNGIEFRYPFLDNEVVSFALQLPDHFKLHELQEKYILRSVGFRYLPKEILLGGKFPFRIPVPVKHFMEDERISYFFSREQLMNGGVLSPDAVTGWLKVIKDKNRITERDERLFLLLLSTQILLSKF